jgi:hypothetical protein
MRQGILYHLRGGRSPLFKVESIFYVILRKRVGRGGGGFLNPIDTVL